MIKIYFLILCFVSIVNAQDFKKDTIELKDTILYDKSTFRLKRLGSDTRTKTVQIGINSDINMKNDSEPKYIKEISIPLNAPKKEFTIQRVNFNFSNPLKVDSIIIRLDLMTEHKGNPNESLLKEPIDIVIRKKDQHENIFTYDLRDLNIKNADDFQIKLMLLTKVDKPIYFSGAHLAKCLYKTEQSTNWEKSPLGITPAINADILIKR